MVLWKELSLVCLYIKMNQSILKPHKEIKAFLFCEMQQSPSLQTPCYHRAMNIEALISGRLKGLAKRREASTLQHKATSPEYQPFIHINKKTKGTTLALYKHINYERRARRVCGQNLHRKMVFSFYCRLICTY